MYDPIGDFFSPYGATADGRSGHRPPTAAGEQRGWDDPGPALDTWPCKPTVETMGPWEPDVLEDVLVEQAQPFGDGPADAFVDARVVPRHRRRPGRAARPWNQIIGSAVGGLSAVTVATVCALGWVLSYDPLHDLACSRVPRGLSALWPLVIYGPWLVSCLSAVRAALDGRWVRQSWIVMILFSSGAAGLCIATSHTVLGMLVAGLPPITALVTLHQLVHQLHADQRGRRQTDPDCAVRRRAR
jgi:hypothetical protein